MPVPREILYLTEADVQKTLTVAEAVDLAEAGIKADAAGRVNGDKYYMDVGENSFIKPFSGSPTTAHTAQTAAKRHRVVATEARVASAILHPPWHESLALLSNGWGISCGEVIRMPWVQGWVGYWLLPTVYCHLGGYGRTG